MTFSSAQSNALPGFWGPHLANILTDSSAYMGLTTNIPPAGIWGHALAYTITFGLRNKLHIKHVKHSTCKTLNMRKYHLKTSIMRHVMSELKSLNVGSCP